METKPRTFRRSVDDDRVIGGVCDGLAEHYQLDPGRVRWAFLILSLFFGLGIAAYISLWLVVPEQEQVEEEGERRPTGLVPWIVRVLFSVAVPIIFFIVMRAGFIWLRGGEAHQLLIAVVAIIWGVGGTALLFVIANAVVEQLPSQWTAAIQPFVFVGPGLAILGWYLFMPVVRSLWASFFDAPTKQFVGLENYVFVFTDRTMLEAFRNNVLWLVIGTGLAVIFGLIIAVLADRTHPVFEVITKSLIFLPMAISFVGAGVIWRLVYAFKPAGQPQIGLLNAVVTAFGADPIGWISEAPINTILFIIVFIWMQAGYAMVILSAALKGVPQELLEAGRIDGATEVQIFLNIMVPYIQGTIITVSTSILLLTLKVFDIVWTMTGGQYGSHVIGTVFFRQMFTFVHNGRASAIAMVLLILVIPVMWYNLKQFQEQEAF
ncbi:MAG TPA: PspC domain-containing protein [Chloroflexi bacterium]|nr:PspC domain-containing protein [Chloroflexota bacterium]